MEALKKYKALLLCFMSLFFMAGMCEPDPDVDEVLVKSVALDKTSAQIKVGKTLTLTATVTPNDATNKKLAWGSSDESVATVENGKVTAVAEGVAAITATAKDGSGKSASCVVTVIANPNPDVVVLVEEIVLGRSHVELEKGETYTLNATVYPEDADDTSLTWTSSDKSVATVANGTITAVGSGLATITATANDESGVSASCEVTVGGDVPDGLVLSPMELKNRLEEVGIEFVSAIEAETHQNLIEVTDYAIATFEDFDLDEAYYEHLESLYEETEEYARRKNPVEAMAGITRACLNVAQNGAQLSTRASEVYTFVVRAGLTDLYGKFTPDYRNEIWKWNSSVNDRIEASFTDDKDQQWVATLKGSKETTRVQLSYDYESLKNKYYDGNYSYTDSYTENAEIVVDVPKQITFTLKCGSNTIISLDLNSSLAFEGSIEENYERNDYYVYNEYWDEYWWDSDEYLDETYVVNVSYSNLNVDAALAVNGYEETFKTDVTKQGITASASVKIDGRTMLKANAGINANIDALISDANNEDFKARNIKDVTANLDILGKVQIAASCPTFKNAYDAAMYLMDAEEIDEINNYVNDMNGTYSVKLCIDNTSTTQATFEIEARETDNGWDGSNTEYYPVMVFAKDNSRRSIEDYFTESAFSDLIDAVEDLAEEFEDLYGDYFDEW